jgi:hypothetical protein
METGFKFDPDIVKELLEKYPNLLKGEEELPVHICFTNVRTRIRFDAQMLGGLDEKYFVLHTSDITSKMDVSDIPKPKGYSYYDALDEILQGNILGKKSLKHFWHPGLTYLLFDGLLFKIGRTNNLKKRMEAMRNANPRAHVIATSEFLPEKVMHTLFRSFRVRGEWFDFDEDFLNYVMWWFSDKDMIKKEAILRYFVYTCSSCQLL